MKFTVLGATGFIGSNLSRYLRKRGHEVEVPGRQMSDVVGRNLGHVIYAIGLTGDFRSRLLDTIEAQSSLFARLLRETEYETFLYLSSTRVYQGMDGGKEAGEDAVLSLTPSADAVYNASKILAESLCVGATESGIRAARLSNVYGAEQSPHTFLGSVLKEAIDTGEVTIGESPLSCKDYVALDDVLPALENIALSGSQAIYNVGSGVNTSHSEIGVALSSCGVKVNFSPGGPVRRFPRIDVSRMRQQFGFAPRSVLKDIPRLLGRIDKGCTKHG